MRLIDADDLKSRTTNYDEEGNRIWYERDIDNVPTVIWCSINSEGLPLMDLRPRSKGEWLIADMRGGRE